MTKKIIILILIIVVSVVAFFLVTGTINKIQLNKIKNLETKISLLKKEITPIRFKILEKDNDKIKVAIKFFDSDNNVITKIIKEVKGTELQFDFLVFKINNQHLVFPYKIFSDEIAPDNGIIITEYYNKKGFPQIFYSKNIDKDMKQYLIEIFEKINNDEITSETDYFGSLIHDVPEYKSFKVNKIYNIITRTKGGIEVIRN